MQQKTFYIIRHGETDWNAKGLLCGITDRQLNEKGINQAKVAGEKIFQNIKKLDFKTIIHSPLSRAKDTAKIINEKLLLPMIEIEELREANCGEFEGKPYFAGEIWDKWMKGEEIGNGVESFEDCIKRVKIGLEKALNYENPLIVAHGGTFVEICEILNTLKDDDGYHFKNCQLYKVENIQGYWTIIENI